MENLEFRVRWVHPESSCNGFDYFDAIDGYRQSDPCQEIIAFDQYIKRNDCHNNKLYENDIVEVVEETISHGDELIRGIISYDDTSCQWVINLKSESIPLCHFIDLGIEKIGNIYENEDLLEKRSRRL
ncbi:MAG: YopX family protein [Candidatus Thorarchaeota archaeon]